MGKGERKRARDKAIQEIEEEAHLLSKIFQQQRGWICSLAESIRGGGTFNNTIKWFYPKR